MSDMCPACRANPELTPVCTICRGKAEVHIVRNGDQVSIYPLDSVIPTFFGTSPYADINSGGLLGMPVGHVSLAQGWEAFRRTCLSDAGPVQIKESRRVFYGAIGWILMALGTEGTDPEADEAYMEAIDKELVAFSADIARGLA